MSSVEVLTTARPASGFEALLTIDQGVLDALPSAVYVCSADGIVVRFNQRAAELWGRSPQPGDTDDCGAFRLYHPDGTPLPHADTPMQAVLRTGEAQRDKEVIIERPDGSRIVALVNIEPLKSAFGAIEGAIAVHVLVDTSGRRQAEAALRAQTNRLDMLNRIAKSLSSDLDLERIVQAVTDSATQLSGAKFGAFFYNVTDDQGERYQLYTLSGAPRAAFDKFGLPRNTVLFDATFRGAGIVRSDDILKDPRYGRSAPHHGMPKGHLPVVSYLAVPVISRSGAVLGGLFFGHDQPGVFTQEAEEIVAGIAAHAAIAIDNAQLLQSAQREIGQRRRAEEFLARRMAEQAALYQFTDRLHRAESLTDIHDAALEAILLALRCARASILLFDDTGMMRFVAWRGLSDSYRRAVDGHSPWTRESKDPQPIFVGDVETADFPEALKNTVKAEGVGALAFIPLVANGTLVGKFMAYYDAPHVFADEEVHLAVTIARQLGFSLERMRAETARRRAEAELRANEEHERARAAELQAIMESVPALIWIARDTECRTIGGNRTSYEILRLPPEANASLSAPTGDRPDHFEVLSEGRVLAPEELPVQRAAHGEEVRNFEEEVRFRDGTSRYLIGNATPLRDGRGKPCGSVAAFVDITEHKRAEQALRESEQRLQLSLEAGRMGAWEWDIPSGKVIWSPSLEAIHGLAPGTFGGRFEDFTRDIHPEDLEPVLAKIHETLETRSGYHLSYRMRRLDGALRWLEVIGRLVPAPDGRPLKLAGVCMDITERKLAEEQRNLLVAELSHRVKNTLTTVISIARQSFSKSSKHDDVYRTFDARIRALAQTHSRLAEENWAGVSFEAMLRDEFAPYRRDDGVNVQMSGPRIALNPKCALTLGMAVHELATNAAKYGALSAKNGVVNVAWQVDYLERQLRIRWQESGGPAVASPERSGFGRLLLERALASDLRGQVQLDFAAGGLQCAIAIPLDEHVARVA